MTDATKELIELGRKEQAVRVEISRCRERINRGKSDAIVVAAEIDALEAELQFLRAQFELMVTVKGAAEAYSKYGLRPKIPKGEDWQDFIAHASSGYEDYRAWFHQFLNSRYPTNLAYDIRSKQRAATEAEDEWVKKIEIWEREYTKHGRGLKR